jgi:hypothetical protein
LKHDLKKDEIAWTGFIWLRIGTVTGSCGHGAELSDSIKCGEILYLLRNF